MPLEPAHRHRAQTSALPRLARIAGLAAVMLASGVGLWLRVRELSFQALWWDEGISIFWAHSNLASLTTAKDFRLGPHLPLYFIILRLWIQALGDGVEQVRLLSALVGAIAVPLSYWVGRLIFGRLSGVIAAFLVAWSPILIFYSQETRMYSLTPVIALASVGVTVFLSQLAAQETQNFAPRALVLWTSWIVLVVAGMYLHYALAPLFLAEFCVLCWSWMRASLRGGAPRLLPSWTAPWIAATCSGLLWLPWLSRMPLLQMSARGSTLFPAASDVPTKFSGFLVKNWEAFTVGFTSPEWAKSGIELWFAALILLTLSRGMTLKRASVWLAILVPIVLSYGGHMLRPVFWPRYVVYVTPLLLLLVANGVVTLAHLGRRLVSMSLSWFPVAGSRFASTALGFTLLLGAVSSLAVGAAWTIIPQQEIQRTAFSSSDYLPLVRRMGQVGSAGDVLLISYPWQAGYAYAYSGMVPAPRAILTFDADHLAQTVQGIVASGRAGWWMGYYPDDQERESWRSGELPRVQGRSLEDWNGDTLLVRYGPPLGQKNLLANSLAGGPTSFGGQIALDGFEAARQQDQRGTSLHLTWQWRALAVPADDYTVFVHVLDASGKIVGQNDSQPNGGLDPTRLWQPGELVIDDIDVPLPPSATQVEIGLYNQVTGVRLKAPDMADHLTFSVTCARSGGIVSDLTPGSRSLQCLGPRVSSP